MKSVITQWETCLQEAGDLCNVRTHRDLAYARKRLAKEGLSFLTITLPAYETSLREALSHERVSSDLFPGFRKRGGLPTFLQGFLRLLFREDGTLSADASPDVLRCLRQVLLLVSKLELPTSLSRNAKALSDYVETDSEVESTFDFDMRNVVRTELNPFFSAVESALFAGEWLPRHSSGALATRESYNSRFGFRTWTERLQEILPWWSDMDPFWNNPEDVTVLPREQEKPVRVALVPKTMKGPRVIAMEPVWNQWVQQGLLQLMTRTLCKPEFTRIRSQFGWMDQEPNRQLARFGSLTGSYATLDLSEASDRVSLAAIEYLLDDHQYLLRAVKACRSERAQLPTGEEIRLRKFASMGSALCFPFEAMLFWAIAKEVARRHGLNPHIRVFGDDIIVPTVCARDTVEALESVGLKVNARKSFLSGPFRESCGADWFKGENVGVVKLRHPFPTVPSDLDLQRSGIEFHNRLFESGWFSSADKAREIVSKTLPCTLYTLVGSTASSFWTDDDRKVKVKVCKDTHRLLYRAYAWKEKKPSDPIDGYAALRKYFQPHGDVREVGHLESDGRSRCVARNISWQR